MSFAAGSTGVTPVERDGKTDKSRSLSAQILSVNTSLGGPWPKLLSDGSRDLRTGAQSSCPFEGVKFIERISPYSLTVVNRAWKAGTPSILPRCLIAYQSHLSTTKNHDEHKERIVP